MKQDMSPTYLEASTSFDASQFDGRPSTARREAVLLEGNRRLVNADRHNAQRVAMGLTSRRWPTYLGWLHTLKACSACLADGDRWLQMRVEDIALHGG